MSTTDDLDDITGDLERKEANRLAEARGFYWLWIIALVFHVGYALFLWLTYSKLMVLTDHLSIIGMLILAPVSMWLLNSGKQGGAVVASIVLALFYYFYLMSNWG